MALGHVKGSVICAKERVQGRLNMMLQQGDITYGYSNLSKGISVGVQVVVTYPSILSQFKRNGPFRRVGPRIRGQQPTQI